MKAVAKLFRINETVAGVTLLAFGNSVTDFFTMVMNISKHTIRIGQLLNGVIASCFFISIFISGVIIVIAPSIMSPSSSSKDILLLLCLVLLIDYIAENDVVTDVEAYVVISVYIAYITVIIVEQLLLHHTNKMIEKELQKTLADEVIDLEQKRESVFVLRKSLLAMQEDLKVTYSKTDDIEYEKKEAEDSTLLWSEFQDPTDNEGTTKNDVHIFERASQEEEKDKHESEEDSSVWQQLKGCVIKFDRQSYKDSNKVMKVFAILMVPIDTFFHLMLPVVNLDKPLNGWSRLLNSFQAFLLPTFMVSTMGN